MKRNQFLETLRKLHINVQLGKDGALDIEAPKGILTQGILEQIGLRKMEFVDYLKSIEKKGSSASIPLTDITAFYPLSSSQKRLFIIHSIDSASPAYNIFNTLELKGQFDAVKFEMAVRAVIRRHEILRTVFREGELGEAGQHILATPDLHFELPYFDWRAEQGRYERAYALIHEDREKGFDLGMWPLFRTMLFRLEEERYIFYYNMHHIISDGWSMNVLNRDILACYEAYCNGQQPQLPSLRIQYKDYAVWQQKDLLNDRFRDHLDFWRKQMRREWPLLDLPAYRKRPLLATRNGYALAITIDQGSASQLGILCRRQQGTLFMGLVTVLKILLYRYTGQEDIVIGTPVSGREYYEELEDQIGCYVNTVLLRTEVRGEDNFMTLLSKVRDISSSAFEHQACAFDKLVEELGVRRDAGRSALFDVMATMHNQQEPAGGEIPVTGGEGAVHDLGRTGAKCDLSFDFEEMGDILRISVQFNSDVYERETIASLLTHYRQLMALLVERPDIRIDRIDYLSDGEKKILLQAFNSTQRDYPHDRTITDLLKEQAIKTPENVAVVFEEHAITYKELDDKATALAVTLSERQVGQGHFIPIIMSRGIDFVVAFMAIWKVGAAGVPLSIDWPPQRLQIILDEVDAPVVLCNPDGLKRSGLDVRGHFICISYESLPPHGELFGPAQADADAPVYMFYTSGSTGLPKGVVVPHKGVVNRLLWMNDYFTPASSAAVLRTTRHIFDSAIWQLFWPLINGGRTVIPSEKYPLDLEYFTQLVNGHRITMTDFVPALFNGLINQIRDTNTAPDLSTLRDIVIGGEAIDVTAANYFRKYYPDIRLTNLYGPTEASIGCIYFTLTGGQYEKIPIGRPISNVRIYIMDKAGGLSAPGTHGEIGISGICLAKGYFRDEARTNAQFIPNPFWKPGEDDSYRMLYKTGDLGRWLPDGNIEFLGRSDDQVKIRGYRIEPGEIEHAINGLEGISSAVVRLYTWPDGHQTLVAYVMIPKVPDTSLLRRKLADSIPEYMIPSLFIPMETFPLTASGKIDRKLLPDPILWKPDSPEEYVAPRNQMEEVLAQAYADVLKKDKVGVTESFFDLGGDSIKAILLVARLRKNGYSVEVANILRYPVIEALKDKISFGGKMPSQAMIEGEVILTPMQRWFLDKNSERAHHYNQSVLLFSKRPVGAPDLRRALQWIIDHHDTLRMVFVRKGSVWQQYNKAIGDSSCYLEEHDLREVADGPQSMSALCDRLQRSLSLTEGPLIKAALFHLSGEDHLLLVIHHLVTDGISWRILLEDLATVYRQLEKGEAPMLPPKTTSFRQWAASLAEYANSGAIAGELDYWRSLPSAAPVSHNDNSSVYFRLNESLTRALLTEVNQAYNTGINDILLTALMIAARDLFDLSSLIIEMEGHGREDIGKNLDISRTIGWFTSTYPVLLDIGKEEDIIRSLISVKEQLRKVPGKRIGYGLLRYLRKEENGRIDEVRADATFNYLGDFGSGVSADSGENVFGYSSYYKGSERDGEFRQETALSVTGMIESSCLEINISYDSRQYSPAMAGKLIAGYQSGLEKLIGILKGTRRRYVTPSDLTYKGLRMEELEIMNAEGDIEDIYGLSPLQEGMYYHWLADRGSPAYVEQMSYRLQGALNIDILRKSYEYLLDRHPILRTSFHYEYGAGNLQVVRRSAISDFRYKDLRACRGEALIKNFREADRAEGFNLAVPSQIRLTVLDLGGQEYEFIWSHHHILMDGWCTAILSSDFYNIYSSLMHGRQPVLGRSTAYAEYIQWLSGLDKSGSAAYWKEYLDGYDRFSGIPFKRPIRPAVPLLKEIRLHLPPDRLSAARELCNKLNVTLNTLIQGAWGYLLSRYNNTNDIVFGNVVSGRPAELEGIEEMIGLFINTIPVRIRYQETTTVEEFLQGIQKEALDSLPHHYLSLPDIQALTSSGNQLFDHIIVHENYPVQEMISEGVKKEKGLEDLTLLSSEVVEQTNYDLGLVVASSPAGMDIFFRYNAAAFSDGAIQRIKDHLDAVINRLLVADIGFRIGMIDYLSTEERDQLLNAFNDTKKAYPSDKSIVQLFAEQVSKTPDNIAVVFQGERFTYRQLDERSERLAHFLHSRWTVSGTLVPVCMSTSMELIVAILAVLKAGGAYVPLDPSYPPDRIRFMITDTTAAIILTDRTTYGLIANEGRDVLLLDKDQDMPAEYPAVATAFPAVPITHTGPHDLAYVMYTSGSTGVPKGVLIEHTAVIRLVKNKWFFKGDEVILSTGSISFDATTFEFWGALLNGGRLILCSKEELMDGGKMKKAIRGLGVTTMWITAGWLNQLVDGDIGLFATLRTLLAGGEKLSVHHIRQLRSAYPSLRIINGYGPTENTTFSCCYEIGNEITRSDGIPIGPPIDNSTAYIFNEHRLLAPVGIVGEIYVGGAGLGRSYLNQDRLTEERFVRNPYRSHERLYRTGDLGRWLPDGNIEYAGRLDDQVKIRGYRVEPGEIEQVLQQLEGVRAAIVTVHTDENEEKSLIAYVVSDGEWQDLRRQLAERLPGYMVPAWFVRMQSFPLTPNGKVDKKKLPLPDICEGQNGMLYEAPRNPTEQQLTLIWQEILKKPRVGISEDFFAIGGHSLKLMQLLNHYHREFGVRPSIAELFENVTVAAHAAVIGHLKTDKYSRIERIPDDIDYPVSDGQRRLWVLSQSEEASRSYHLRGRMVLEGNYSPGYFEQAVRQLIERHEILRTGFVQNASGELRQIVFPPEGVIFRLDHKDWEDSPDIVVDEYIDTACSEIFDLGSAPLFRAGLLRTGEDRYCFYYCMHHIISDGWSMRLLAEEIMEYYDAYSGNGSCNLRSLRIQYRDYAAWQLSRLQGPQLLEDRRYWLERLGGHLPVMELPSYKMRPAFSTHKGYAVRTMIGKGPATRLREFCRKHNGTLFMGLLAILKTLLYRYTGQEDIIIGSPVAGRDHSELEDQIGFYLNTLALRTLVRGQDDFEEIFRKIRQTTLQAYDHQAYPFDRLVEDLDVRRDPGRSAVFDIMLVLQNEWETPAGADDENAADEQVVEEGMTAVKFDLSFSFEETEGGLALYLEYNDDILDRQQVVQLIRHYKNILTSAMNDPALPVGQLDYLTDDERDRALSVSRTLKMDLCIPTVMDLFSEQVRRVPDSIALAGEARRMTYRHLDETINQWAHYLRWKGVVEGTLVIVCLDRSFDLVLVIWSILKAGGTYVPVDPAYPEERVQAMVGDCGASVIVTEGRYRHLFGRVERKILISADEERDSIREEPLTAVPAVWLPENLAYVMYTSGSTGRPKGVMIEHRNLSNYLQWAANMYAPEQGAGDLALYTSVSFDLTVTSLFGPFIKGQCLHIFPREYDVMEALTRYLDPSRGLEIIKLTPAHLQLIGTSDIRKTGIRKIIVGGEQLQSWHMDIVRELGNEIIVYNEYGPTETTVGVTVARIGPMDAGKIHIGNPVPHSYIYILDKQRNLVPPGVMGELYIGGLQVARGYLNNKELTDERFINDPFREGARLYRSGDLGRWLPDGNIAYMGRVDDQVKIRGYRVEPGEVEDVLCSLEGVSSAAVIPLPARDGNKYLAAYFTGTAELPALRQQMKELLPGYMIPDYWQQMQTLPLTDNAKIDRKALPLLSPPDEKREADFLAPRNEVERILVQACQHALKREGISLRSDFFALGGSSIQIITVVHYLKKAGYLLKQEDIIRYPVLEELALKVERSDVPAPVLYPRKAARSRYYELSYNQMIYYRENEFDHAIGVFDLPMQGFDKSKFLASYKRVLREFEMLRVSFCRRKGGIFQKIQPVEKVIGSVRFIRQDSLNPDDPGIIRLRSEMMELPLDLFNGEAIRCGVLHDRENAIALFVIHHAVTDHYSNRRIRQALMEYYAGTRTFSPPAFSYFDLIQAQKDFLASKPASEKLSSWMSTLDSIAGGRKVARKGEKGGPGKKMVICRYSLDAQRQTLLHQHCIRERLFPGNFILSAFSLLYYSEYAGEEEVLMEVVVNEGDMMIPGLVIDNAAGVFANTMPLKLVLGNKMKWRDIPSYIQNVYMKGRSDQQVPIRLIKDEFSRRYGSHLDGYIASSFNYLDLTDQHFAAGEIRDERPYLPGIHDRTGGNRFIRCIEYSNVLYMEWLMSCDPEELDRRLNENYFTGKMDSILQRLMADTDDAIDDR